MTDLEFVLEHFTCLCGFLCHLFVLTKLESGNATLAGIPSFQLDRLQAVMNAAARLVFQSSRHDHITPLPLPSALASCAGANSIQTRRAGVPVCPWTGAGLPG